MLKFWYKKAGPKSPYYKLRFTVHIQKYVCEQKNTIMQYKKYENALMQLNRNYGFNRDMNSKIKDWQYLQVPIFLFKIFLY